MPVTRADCLFMEFSALIGSSGQGCHKKVFSFLLHEQGGEETRPNTL